MELHFWVNISCMEVKDQSFALEIFKNLIQKKQERIAKQHRNACLQNYGTS